jgi:hypothetical protein
MCIHSQDEQHSALIPSIQLRGVREIGVAAQGDPPRNRPHQMDGPINPTDAVLG